MAYNQPQHGGAADDYYSGGQQDSGVAQQPQLAQVTPRPYQSPAHDSKDYPQQQYQQPPPQQYQAPPPEQYVQQPPVYNGNGDGKQSDGQDFQQKFRVEKPKFNDLWATILFIITFAGFVVVSGLALRGYSSTSGQQRGSTALELNRSTIVLFSYLLAVAFVFSFAYFWLIRAFTKQAIWITGILQIVFGIGTAIYYFIKGHYPSAVVFLIFGVVYIFFFISWIPRIPFSVLMLQTVIDVSKNYGHVFVVSLLGGIVATAFGAWYSITMVSIYAKWYPGSPTCSEGTSCSTAKAIGLLVFATFAMYWISEVIKNVIHVTIAGVYGSWYFFSQKPGGMPKAATRGAFKRAMTYSFGSISLGSLIVAIIQFLRQAASIGQQNASQDGNIVGVVLFCILGCLIGILEWAIQFINEYAFSYIALYGKAYFQAAKATWTMMKDRGVDALVNECLINPVLTMGSVFVAYLTTLFAFLYLQFTKPAYNAPLNSVGSDYSVADGRFTVVIMAFSFLVGLQICNIFMVPIKSGVATFFVAMAFDPEVLMRDYPDLYNRIVAVYPHVQTMIQA